jgi:Flp pilus assembly protein TadG
MQRLTDLVRGRLSDERGATAVVFALLLVPMLGFAAIAVDIGSLYAERARLQVAADAAAIAVAQDCSRGACGDMLATARAMVTANDGDASTAQPVLDNAPLSVTVTGRTPVQHWFAPVIGHDATGVSATATVGWGAPSGGTAVLPLTFSWCEFSQMTGGGLPSGTTVRTIYFTKTSGTTGCTGPSHNIVPGGFAYLDTPSGKCEAASARAERSYSSTGNSVPSDCSTADFSAWIGQTVLLPLFEESGATGSNAWYRVYGYAAFRLTGFHLGGQYSTTPKPCSGNERCVTGYFTRFVDLSDRFDYSPDAPKLGASILRLIR